MSRGVRRLVVLLAGLAGLLTLFDGVAQAYVTNNGNHCEPLRR